MAAGGVYSDDSRRGLVSGGADLRALLRLAPTAVLVLGSGLLVARRCAGALTASPSPWLAAVCSVVVIGLLCAAYQAAPGSPIARLAQFLATIAFAAALTLPHSSMAARVLLWATPAGLLLWTAYDRRRSAKQAVTAIVEPPPRVRRTLSETKRFTEADGAETIEGTALAEFAVGQRSASIHLAFCPPLPASPTMTCEPIDDVDVEAQVVQSLAYAARIDLRLAEAAEEPIGVVVRFSAHSDTGR